MKSPEDSPYESLADVKPMLPDRFRKGFSLPKLNGTRKINPQVNHVAKTDPQRADVRLRRFD